MRPFSQIAKWFAKPELAKAQAAPNPAPEAMAQEVGYAQSSLYDTLQNPRYNPDPLYQRRGDYYLFEKMRGDDQIKPVLELKKSIILGAGYHIETDDDKIRTYWDYVLGDKYDGVFTDALLEMLTCLDFGFSLTEIIYGIDKVNELGTGPLWVLKALKTRPPHSLEFDITPQGNLSEITQVTDRGERIQLPPAKFIHFPYQPEFGNPYGKSDLTVAVYRAWFSKDAIIKFWNIYLERFAMPTPWGKYPNGTSTTTKNNLASALKNLSAKDYITTENTLEIEFLSRDVAKGIYKEAIDTHDLRIARAMLMPDLFGLSGEQTRSGGLGSSLGLTQFAMFFEVMKKIRASLLTRLNRQVIMPLTELNFGDNTYAELKFRELSKEDEYKAVEMFLEYVSKGGGKATKEQMVWLCDTIGAPTGELEAMSDEELFPPPPPIPGQEVPGQDKAIADKTGQNQGGSVSKSDTGKKTPESSSESQGVANSKKASEEQEARKMAYAREMTRYERKVDFAKINNDLDELNAKHRQTIGEQIKQMLNNLRRYIQSRGIVEKQRYDLINDQMRLMGMRDLQSKVLAMMKDAYAKGKNSTTTHKGMAVFDTDPALDNADVAEWLREASIYTTTEEGQALLRIAKGTLMDAIRSGAGVKETMQMLEDQFEAWDIEAEAPRLENIVRTNTLKAFNQARAAEFAKQKDAIVGYQFSAILDSRTSPICNSLDRRLFKPAEIDYYNPPLHYMCRSVIVPVYKGDATADEIAKESSEMPATTREKGGFLKLKK